MDTYTAEQAVEELVYAGYDRDDVGAVVDSLIDAGLELPQPDDDDDAQYVLTAEEVELVRTQLAA